QIIKSTLQVSYFSIKKDRATPLLSLHYDYELPIRPAHPVFHVQLGESNISVTEYNQLGFKKTIEDSKVPLYGHLRIPTAHMNLGSVLLGLVADHLPNASFNTFLRHVRGNQVSRWSAACLSLKNSLSRGTYFHSHHWYCPL